MAEDLYDDMKKTKDFGPNDDDDRCDSDGGKQWKRTLA